MRRLAPAAVLVLALAACGGSSKSLHVEFGTSGGNILPHAFSVSVNGNLAGDLRSAFASAGFVSRQCSGTLPDEATEYIRIDGRKVSVRGACEPRFTRLWNKLYIWSKLQRGPG